MAKTILTFTFCSFSTIEESGTRILCHLQVGTRILFSYSRVRVWPSVARAQVVVRELSGILGVSDLLSVQTSGRYQIHTSYVLIGRVTSHAGKSLSEDGCNKIS